MDARQLAAAGMLARGATQEHVAGLVSPPVSVRTIRRWLKLPAFQAEMRRVEENSTGPSPEGVLLDALSATTNDGVRWDTRVKAAIELRNRPTPGQPGANGGANAGGGLIHMKVVMYECSKCGEMSMTPPPGFEPGEIIDAEEAVEVPGHGMLPPAPEPNR